MSKPQAPSLTIKRKLNAPAEKVFAAWTQPEALKRWFAPRDEMAIPLAETDVRVGGHYRIVMRKPDGEEHRVGGVYREIVPGQKLVFTWAWESTPQRESLVTVEIKPIAGGCELTFTHERFFDEAARDRHQQGWAGSMERLERYLADVAGQRKDKA
jgi:uncharacterized protein YndB with AHSA1/START domain